MSEHDDRKPGCDERSLDRRRFVALCGAVGVGAMAPMVSPLLAAGKPEKGKITKGDLIAIEDLTGLHFKDPQRDLMMKGLEDQKQAYVQLRQVVLDNSVPPALRFDPAPPGIGPQAPTEVPDRPPFRR